MERSPLLNRWSEVDAVFCALLDVPAAERTGYLAACCEGDPELRSAVESLLTASEAADGFLESGGQTPFGPTLGDLAAVIEAEADEGGEGVLPEGGRIGSYRLVRELGRGGSGTVYLAERVDGEFEQRVAIKLLRRGLDTDDILARFRAERQILASLNHPHIARLFDGGATGEGRPYLVMELVEGWPITEYCDARRCTIEERLRLFMQVARAVQHAHLNLIVHRDIKPSNILVTEDGTPKLLDFGIAKLLDDSLGPDRSPHTRPGLRLMTPEYASPEQVRGEPVTTASDAYQLGMLLYRLLAGRRPYRLRGRAPAEIERAFREQEPMPSSVALVREPGAEARGEVAPEELARLRRTDARRLRARLRGDLDTILLRAVQKEPERRYASAGALADDVERYLSGRPVAARPDTRLYRAQKFVGRRPGVVAAGLVVLLSAGAYTGTLQAHADRLEAERNVARQERARAESERDGAESERSRAEAAQAVAEGERNRARSEFERAELEAGRARDAQQSAESARAGTEAERNRAETALRDALIQTGRAEQATTFLASLFRAAQPGSEARGDTVSARTLLVRGAERVRAELADQPEIAVELLWTIGEVQNDLGMRDEARDLLGGVIATSRRLHGSDHAIVAANLARLGRIYLGRRGFREAEVHLEEAVSILRQQQTGDPLVLAGVLTELAAAHRENGNTERAESTLREALEVYRARVPENHIRVWRAKATLARVLRSLDRWDDAERLYRELLTAASVVPDATATDLAGVRNDLAYLLRMKEEYPEAERLYRESLIGTRQGLGPAHRSGQVVAGNLASVLELQGKLAEAEALLLQEVELHRAHFPENHWRIGHSIGTLAGFFRASGQPGAAESWSRRQVGIYEASLGADHAWTLRARSNLAHSLTRLDRTAEAEEHLLAVHETLQKAEMTAQMREAGKATLEGLVDLYTKLGNAEQASRYRLLLDATDRSGSP
ncbi:MAG: tetratricopeptide repeat protein [Gemmatimonadetes bacterium]|nr:tetratricopeptide repeat protein [Gemmatimonadota bacterium]